MRTIVSAAPTSVSSPAGQATRTRFHALAWTAWAFGALACIQIAPNVLDVAIVVLVSALVVSTHRTPYAPRGSFAMVIVLAVVFGAVRVVITALTVHEGGRVLFTLPLTGDVVLEPIVRTAAESFVIVGIVVVFAAWNSVVSHHELLASVPRAFHELALVATIALAFVPSVISAVQRARESDRARTGGTVVRRGRILRTLLPVLETALDRATLLAETMDARGFAHAPVGRSERLAARLTLAGLVAVVAALAALASQADAVSAALALTGLAAMLGAMVVAGRSNERHRYRPRALTRLDGVVIAVSALAPLLVALGDPAGRRWDAGTLTLPPFDAVVAAGLLLLALPALWSEPT